MQIGGLSLDFRYLASKPRLLVDSIMSILSALTRLSKNLQICCWKIKVGYHSKILNDFKSLPNPLKKNILEEMRNLNGRP